MHWITRVFVSAFSLLFSGLVLAQSTLDSEGVAYQKALAWQSQTLSTGCAGIEPHRVYAGNVFKSSDAQNGHYWRAEVNWVATDGVICYAVYRYDISNTCGNQSDVTGIGPWSSMSPGQTRNGTTTCDNGCWRSWYHNGDGTMTGKTTLGEVCSAPNEDTCASIGGGFYYNSNLLACELPEVETCPPGQTKDANGVCQVSSCPPGMTQNANGVCLNEKNDCPAGQVKSPTGQCLPGEGQCAQGEARRPNGTCGKDSDGDGVADDDDDNPDNDSDKETFSGGDNCTSPPSCSGSPVACGMARIQWRIECNTRRNVNIQGGACNAMPVCVGDNCNAMEYSQLLQQWKAACALEKLASQQPGQGGGGDNSDLIAYLSSGGTVNTDAMGNGGIEVGDPWGDGTGSPGDDFQPDGSGFGYSSSCPTFPVVNVMGTTLDFNNGPLCDWLALGGQLVLILAALASLRIVAGSAA